MMRCIVGVFVLAISNVEALSNWPIQYEPTADTVPNVELSLAPPLHPWPQVSAEIGNLEDAREVLEQESIAKLEEAKVRALDVAKGRIGGLIGRAMHTFDDNFVAKRGAGFLAIQQEPETVGAVFGDQLSVKVNVLGDGGEPAAVLKTKIDNIEQSRFEQEKNMFESTFVEINSLTDFVVNELEAQINSQINTVLGHTNGASFMEMIEDALPQQSNVRIVPSEHYPTISSMVQDMETRRGAIEQLERVKILTTELALLKEENAMIKEAMDVAIKRIVAQYAPSAQTISRI